MGFGGAVAFGAGVADSPRCSLLGPALATPASSSAEIRSTCHKTALRVTYVLSRPFGGRQLKNEGDRMRQKRQKVGLTRLRVLLLAAMCAIASTVVVATAVAASYRYCDGCTINSNDQRTSAASRNATSSYVHRLSGPSSDSAVNISARAFVTNGPLVCIATNYVRAISCPPGGAYVRGQAVNWGAGNYGFNAHLAW